MSLTACPWCSATENLSHERNLSAHWIRCSCGATGPMAQNDDPIDGRDAAEDLWNLKGAVDPRETFRVSEPRKRAKATITGFPATPKIYHHPDIIEEPILPRKPPPKRISREPVRTETEIRQMVGAAQSMLLGDTEKLVKYYMVIRNNVLDNPVNRSNLSG